MPFDAPNIGGNRGSLLRAASLSEHEPVSEVFEAADAEFFDRDRLAIEFALFGGIATSCDLTEQDFRLTPGLLGGPHSMQADGEATRAAISGTLQLNVASWIAVICFFIGGAVIANLMFRI